MTADPVRSADRAIGSRGEGAAGATSRSLDPRAAGVGSVNADSLDGRCTDADPRTAYSGGEARLGAVPLPHGTAGEAVPSGSGIGVRGLRVSFDDNPVLEGVDLSVAPGEWVNVVGPNGAGKTTLLRSLLGAVRHSGRISIDGSSGHSTMERARALAYVPQNPVMPPAMLVVDYVLLGRTPHRGAFSADTAEDLAVAAEVLARLDLDGFAERHVGSLSGGERQRAVLARALAQQAPVLLLDEPTTALDLGHQQAVLDLVDALRSERSLTVLATLHDLTLAARYGDRVALLAAGRIAADGAPADVLTEESIRRWFGAEARVLDDGDGPVIVPRRSTASRSAGLFGFEGTAAARDPGAAWGVPGSGMQAVERSAALRRRPDEAVPADHAAVEAGAAGAARRAVHNARVSRGEPDSNAGEAAGTIGTKGASPTDETTTS